MLTQEQINKLKPYDTLILNNYPISYLGTYTSGIIGALDDKAEACCYTRCHFPQQYLSLPPKHDPTRLFKKGDKVRMVEWHGRSFFDGGCHPNCNKWTVTEDETSGVNIEQDGHTISDVPACYLELITPVEELEPYSVHAILGNNGKPAFFAVRKGDVSVAAFFCDTPRAFTEEQALAAAEAERDRLNAEWRKEQNNG